MACKFSHDFIDAITHGKTNTHTHHSAICSQVSDWECRASSYRPSTDLVTEYPTPRWKRLTQPYVCRSSQCQKMMFPFQKTHILEFSPKPGTTLIDEETSSGEGTSHRVKIIAIQPKAVNMQPARTLPPVDKPKIEEKHQYFTTDAAHIQCCWAKRGATLN